MKELEIVSAGDASANIDSAPVDLGEQKEYSIQVTFVGGTAAGTLSLEASNDSTTFATVADSDQIIAGGAPHVYNVGNAGYRFFRLHWERSGGSDTMTAKCLIKEPSNRY